MSPVKTLGISGLWVCNHLRAALSLCALRGAPVKCFRSAQRNFELGLVLEGMRSKRAFASLCAAVGGGYIPLQGACEANASGALGREFELDSVCSSGRASHCGPSGANLVGGSSVFSLPGRPLFALQR